MMRCTWSNIHVLIHTQPWGEYPVIFSANIRSTRTCTRTRTYTRSRVIVVSASNGFHENLSMSTFILNLCMPRTIIHLRPLRIIIGKRTNRGQLFVQCFRTFGNTRIFSCFPPRTLQLFLFVVSGICLNKRSMGRSPCTLHLFCRLE